MINRDRAEQFARLVALELKGKIVAHGFTAKAVAEGIDRPAATMNRWLNGKLELPLSVFGEACEYINIDPHQVMEDAYSRLVILHGERDGFTYSEESVAEASKELSALESASPSNVIHAKFTKAKNVGGADEDDIVIPDNVEEAWLGEYAADPSGDDPIDHGAP